MLSLKITKITFLLIGVCVSFGFITPNSKQLNKDKKTKTIIDKIEQNLLNGWSITHIDDNDDKFSDEMKILGFSYGLTLINQLHPIIVQTPNGHSKEFPELKIMVSSLEKREKMKNFVQEKAKYNSFHHCFIESRKYLLTLTWTEPQVKSNENKQEELYNAKNQAKYQKSRRKFIKQLNWYFEMY